MRLVLDPGLLVLKLSARRRLLCCMLATSSCSQMIGPLTALKISWSIGLSSRVASVPMHQMVYKPFHRTTLPTQCALLHRCALWLAAHSSLCLCGDWASSPRCCSISCGERTHSVLAVRSLQLFPTRVSHHCSPRCPRCASSVLSVLCCSRSEPLSPRPLLSACVSVRSSCLRSAARSLVVAGDQPTHRSSCAVTDTAATAVAETAAQQEEQQRLHLRSAWLTHW